MKRLAILLPLLIGFSGCMKTGRLYNLDNGEVTEFRYTDVGRGTGTITGVLKSGEAFHGEYSTVVSGTIGWGSIYSNVSSGAAYATANTTGLSTSISGERRGTAIMTGDKGIIIDCEYVAGMNGHGAGACKDNHGIKYKMMF